MCKYKPDVRYVGLAMLWILASPPLFAQPEALNLESTITGSQEQPNVVYIVPWQAPAPASGLANTRITEILQKEVLGFIDREVFQREITYYQKLQHRSAQK